MSMNTKVVLVALGLALLLLVSCAPRSMVKTPEVVQKVQPNVEVTPKTTTTVAASNIESSSANVEQIDKDLDTTELDSLDKDLTTIDSLDI